MKFESFTYRLLFLSLLWILFCGMISQKNDKDEIWNRCLNTFQQLQSYNLTIESYSLDKTGEKLALNTIVAGMNSEVSFMDSKSFVRIHEENYSLIINHLGKQIKYSENPNQAILIPLDLSMLNSLSSSKAKFIESEDGFIFEFKENEFGNVQTKIEVSKELNLLKSMSYSYLDSEETIRTDLNYKNVNQKIDFPDRFKTRTYILKKNKQIKLAESFSTYKLILAQ